ncbi:trypsin-like serine protease, partial [Conidiobolus coronatus NRRL 28638]
IVGGQQSQAFAYPFMVFVTDQRQQCGGTIVGRNLVVTAAHCIGSRNPSEYRVVGHRHNLQTDAGSERAVTFQVKQVVVHPSYNTQNFDNDIALLVLNNDNPSAIQGADMDRMIQIDTQGPKEGGTTKVIGWGRTQGGGQTSPVLKETELRVLSGDQCSRMFGAFNPSYKICAGAIRQGDSACQGDSGGPLVSGNTLVGVVSHGAPNCNGPASVYTRVANYANWINQYR